MLPFARIKRAMTPDSLNEGLPSTARGPKEVGGDYCGTGSPHVKGKFLPEHDPHAPTGVAPRRLHRVEHCRPGRGRRAMAITIELFTPERAVNDSVSTRVHVHALNGEAFDLVDVQALVDPGDQQRLDRVALRAHLAG